MPNSRILQGPRDKTGQGGAKRDPAVARGAAEFCIRLRSRPRPRRPALLRPCRISHHVRLFSSMQNLAQRSAPHIHAESRIMYASLLPCRISHHVRLPASMQNPAPRPTPAFMQNPASCTAPHVHAESRITYGSLRPRRILHHAWPPGRSGSRPARAQLTPGPEGVVPLLARAGAARSGFCRGCKRRRDRRSVV